MRSFRLGPPRDIGRAGRTATQACPHHQAGPMSALVSECSGGSRWTLFSVLILIGFGVLHREFPLHRWPGLN